MIAASSGSAISGATSGWSTSTPITASISPSISISARSAPGPCRLDVGGRHVRLHVLVAGQHPRHALEVDAVLRGEDAAGPDAGGDGVAAVHADAAALEILGVADARAGVVPDRAVMETAHQEDRQRGERDAVLARGEIGGQRHLADVELQRAHHPAKALDQHRDLLELQREARRSDGAVLQRLVGALGSGQRRQHTIRLRHPSLSVSSGCDHRLGILA